MKESDIMRILAEQEEVMDYGGSPVHYDKVFIIMWQSSKTGGTYTELRKSLRGKNRFLRGLNYYGVNLKEVKIIEVPKSWVPEPKSKIKNKLKGGKK